jgi:transposase InsO family protein
VHSILARAGLNRLDRGDRASSPIVRYQRERPGELVHVDVKKLAAIPDGGGWRARGRARRPERGVGYRYLHTAIDDRSRLAYTETLGDERGATAAGFLIRSVAWFAARGVTVERVLTDNGACYRSDAWREACRTGGVRHMRTRPFRPQTNGKVERFHRILVEEWAYIRPWWTETERQAGLAHFLHFYNHHRPHGSLNWRTPISQLNRDNLPDQHS